MTDISQQNYLCALRKFGDFPKASHSVLGTRRFLTPSQSIDPRVTAFNRDVTTSPRQRCSKRMGIAR